MNQSNKNSSIGALAVAVGLYLIAESVMPNDYFNEGFGWTLIGDQCSADSSASANNGGSGRIPLNQIKFQASCAGSVLFSLFLLLGGLVSILLGAVSFKSGTHMGLGALSAAFAFNSLSLITYGLDKMLRLEFCELKFDPTDLKPTSSNYNSNACLSTIITTITLFAGVFFGLAGTAVALAPSQKLPKAILSGAGLVGTVVSWMLTQAIGEFITASNFESSKYKTGMIVHGVLMVLAFIAAPISVAFALLHSRQNDNEHSNDPALDFHYKGAPENEPLLV